MSDGVYYPADDGKQAVEELEGLQITQLHFLNHAAKSVLFLLFFHWSTTTPLVAPPRIRIIIVAFDTTSIGFPPTRNRPSES